MLKQMMSERRMKRRKRCAAVMALCEATAATSVQSGVWMGTQEPGEVGPWREKLQGNRLTLKFQVFVRFLFVVPGWHSQ